MIDVKNQEIDIIWTLFLLSFECALIFAVIYLV